VVAILIVVTVATGGLLVITLARPDLAATGLRTWLVVVGIAGLVAGALSTLVFYPPHVQSMFGKAMEQREPPAEPLQRAHQIERMVIAAEWDARDYFGRLQPLLRTIAAQRLATYLNIDLETEPEAARAVLGERAWALLTPPANPWNRDAPGVGLNDVRLLVEALEQLNGDHNPNDSSRH
jgi:hypothetical protein